MTNQYSKNVVGFLAHDVNPVYFDHFVSDVDQARSVSRSPVHHPCYHDFSGRFVTFYCRALYTKHTRQTLY